MGKPVLKTLAVLAAGAGALTVCFVGYKANTNKQYEQRVQYAKTALDKDQTELSAIEQSIKAFYKDDKQVFLKNDIKDTDLSQTGAKLDSLKVSAEEFSIAEKDLPKSAGTINQEKERLNHLMDDAEIKYKIQQSVNALFEQPVKTWDKATNDVIIKEKLKETEMGEIRERVSLMDKEDGWTKVVKEYLDFATAQLKRANTIQASIDKMLKNGEITKSATYESYLSLVDSISQVRNAKLKENFTKSAQAISKQLGVSSGSVETNNSYTEGSYGTGTESSNGSDSLY